MNELSLILNRAPKPRPWSEGDNIPWDDPGFSQRMLKEHLTQEHDHASRRTDKIEGHVGWIHTDLLKGQPSRILDLGCGPGLYANRLAKLGHTCTGIDFSSASITYARDHADANVTFVEGDIRCTPFGEGYNLVMQIFGELNAFRPAEAEAILRKAFGALAPGGRLLLEVSTYEAIVASGKTPRDWYSGRSGLWSSRPFICLEEPSWDEEASAATNRYYVIDVESSAVQAWASSYQAYTEVDYRALLERAGFRQVTFLEGLGGAPCSEAFLAVIATKE